MANDSSRLLNVREVCAMLGISPSTLRWLIRKGLFRPPVKPSPGTSIWPKEYVDDYVSGLPVDLWRPKN